MLLYPHEAVVWKPTSHSLSRDRNPQRRRNLKLRGTATAALAISASLLLSPAARAEPVERTTTEKVSGVNDHAKALLQKMGGKILQLSRQKSKKQEVQSRIAEGGYRSIYIVKHSPATKGAPGKGTYLLTATFRGYAKKPKLSNLVHAAASQNAGPGGTYTSLDIRKCETGYKFAGEYAGADGPTIFADGYTQPESNEHGLNTSEIREIRSQYSFILKAASGGSPINRAFLPPFPASPDAPADPRC